MLAWLVDAAFLASVVLIIASVYINIRTLTMLVELRAVQAKMAANLEAFKQAKNQGLM